MRLIVVYPTTAKTGNTKAPYRGWTNINRVKLEDNTYSECRYIESKNKTYNTPAPVTVTFPINLDDKVKVSRISVKYKDYRGEYNGSWARFNAPSVTLNGTGLPAKYGESSKTQPQMWTVDFNDLSLQGKDINTDKFNVTLQYPKNTNTGSGNLFLDCIYLYIYFEDPVYVLSNGLGKNGTYQNPVEETIIGDIVENTIYFRNRDRIPDTAQTITIEDSEGLELLEVECDEGTFDFNNKTWLVTPPVDCDYPSNVVSLKCKYLCTRTGDYQATATHSSAGTVHYKVHTSDYLPPSTDDYYTGDDRVILKYDYAEADTSFPVDIIIANPRKFKDKTCRYKFTSNLQSISLALESISLDPSSVNVESCSFHEDYININTKKSDGGFIAILNTVLKFNGDSGDYTLTITDDKKEEYPFTFQFYDTIGFVATMKATKLEVKKTFMVTEAEGGGYVIKAKSNPNRNYYQIYKDTLKGFIEQHYRHIGNLILPSSHYEPNFNYSNTLTESAYKNRKYIGKKGDWSESLSLNITLPKYLWTSLKGFVQMDKPFWINTAPSCSTDDLLNHRGWGVISKINDLKRINSWHYKGSLTVDYLTHDYNPLLNIELGNRVCNIDVPHDSLKILDYGTDISGFYSIQGTGLFTYDYSTGRPSPNNIQCETGQTIELTNKWTVTNYSEYSFNWNSYLPFNSNDYENNTIQFQIIDNTNGNILLRYLLYDFQYLNEYDDKVNTCKASCVKYEDSGSYSLFNDTITLDYTGSMGYGSTVEFTFNNGSLNLSDYGNGHYNTLIRNIELPPTEYKIRIIFKNNDVGLLEPTFRSTLDVSAYENSSGTVYSNYYNGLMVSPCMLPDHELVFYRETEKGLLYYYTGEESTARYFADPFDQYKGGVNLESENGVSIVTTDSGVNPLYLNNGLVKLGFDKVFGVVRIYLYDNKLNIWDYIQSLRVANFEEFHINSISDDFISLQFGDTVWSMWRGRPFIQVEHGEDDLQIIDAYEYIQCEELIDSDGTVHHSGAFEEIYLNRKRTQTYLSIPVRSVKVGEGVSATACIWDSGEHQIAYDDTYNPYGSVNFMDGDTLIESREYPNSNWTRLNRLMNNNETVDVRTNYVYNTTTDKQLIEGIIVDHDKVVNGNFNIFDCSHTAHLFQVQEGVTLTLRNCILINGRESPLVGVSYGTTQGTIRLENCTIETNDDDDEVVVEDYTGEITVNPDTGNYALLKSYK